MGHASLEVERASLVRIRPTGSSTRSMSRGNGLDLRGSMRTVLRLGILSCQVGALRRRACTTF